ncbi:amino acid adenylation domain-containing protein [Arachnia propionica]|uniref:Amino acid adenylation domain-containing protein n=1 Tax=Arachnia propionica TaxID=1750 RepID=A0A3P1TC23_9ACTN|nr:non-ribosomal peptide synthetase [Arachnia propionica]RRD06033.1 amino acid adenylation domain-containing protein [Arachnia propionica]
MTSLTSSDMTDTLPTSPIQAAYAIGADPHQPLGGQHCLGYVEFAGRTIDIDRLGSAVRGLHRHPSLRATMPDPGHLKDRRPAPATLTVNDLRSCPTPEEELTAIRHRLNHFPVDLTTGRTWSVEATLLPDGTTIVHILASLIVTDLAGIGRMAADLAAGLAHPSSPLTRYTFPELSTALGRRPAPSARRDPDPRREPVLPAPELPEGTPTPTATTDRLLHLIPDGTWRHIAGHARRLRVSPTALVLGVFEECLRRWSTVPEFIVTVTGVDTRGTEDHVADRTRTFLHRSLPASDLATLAAEAGQELRCRLSRGVEATEELRRALAEEGHSGMSPYVFTYAPDTPLFPAEVIETLGEAQTPRSSTPQVIIDCQIIRITDAGVTVSFDVRRGALDPHVAEQLFTTFINALLRLAAAGRDGLDPTLESLITLPQDTLDARARVNSVPRVAGGLLHAPVIAAATRTPDAPALLWDPAQHPAHPTGVMTYRHLMARVRGLAGRIAATVAPGSVVGIRLPKGPDQVVAVLAVLYAGCCYLPLGVDQPEERVARIRDASGMALLVDSDVIASEDGHELGSPVDVDEDQVAYIIYTSGSTGEPKGVAIRHHSAANTVADVNSRNDVGPADRTLAVSALDFDLSVYDIFGPLSVGGAVVLISEASRRDAFHWADLVRRHAVTVWNSVPNLAEMLCVAADQPLGLRRVLCSGDWIDPGLPARLADVAPGACLVAMGGATEAAIWSNEFVVTAPEDLDPAWASIPYGIPLSGQRYRVADPSGRDCPDRVTGELWIGGVGVAAGYHAAEELTADRFVEVDGERWYRTGDLGMWLPGPLLIFLGRADTQVKVRGHRIECGEVEHALHQLPGVQETVVTPIRNRSALGAVLVGEGPDDETIIAALRERLPGYMIPAVFARAEELRLTSNGKTDRRWARELLEAGRPGGHADPVDSPVAEEWMAVLGVDHVDVEQNFFSVGGDSLMATDLCSRLRRHGLDVTVADLFSAPRFTDLEQLCRRTRVPSPTTTTTVTPTGAFPLTPLQRAYALGADGMVGVVRTSPLFATILETRDGSAIDLARLAATATDLVAELDVLRCRRVEDTCQDVAASSPVVPRHVADLTTALRDPVLDLEHSPVLELLTDGTPGRVGLRLSYLPLDARSLACVLSCLLDDAAGVARRLSVAPDLTAFRRHCAQQAAIEEDPVPEDAPALPPAPTLAHRHPSGEPVWAASRRLHVPTAQVAQLTRRARELGVTESALLLHAFAEQLGRVTGQERMGIIVPVSYRPADLDHEVLGNFTTLSLCAAGPGVDLAEVHSALGRAAGGIAPDGNRIVHAGRAAYPVVFTSTIGVATARDATVGHLRPVWSLTSTPGVLVDCQVESRDDGLEIRLDHPEGIVDGDVIDLLLHGMAEALGVAPSAPEASSPGPGDLAWQESLLVSAREAAADHPVRPGLEAVAAAWHAYQPTTAPVPVPPDLAGLLADCITGRSRATTLLEHPDLSPQALLLASPGIDAVLQDLVSVIRGLPDPATVVELGCGIGLFRDVVLAALRTTDPGRADRLRWISVEPDALLRDLALDRGVRALQSAPVEPVDLVVACASLHRDPRLRTELTRISGGRCWVLEIPDLQITSLLSAALVNPDVVKADGPLKGLPHWWRMVEEAGWRPVSVTAHDPAFLILHARAKAPSPTVSRAPAPTIAAAPEPAPSSPPAVGVRNLLRDLWQRHLGVSGVDDDSDFFALGGDSLTATRVLADLRAAGHRPRLVELFNHPRLADLAALLSTRDTSSPPTPAGPGPVPSPETPRPGHRLTEVQQAYLAGRAPQQLLGGVSAHCYYEFRCDDFDAARFTAAVETVVRDHPGLRTLVDQEARIVDTVPSVVTEHPDPRGATRTEVVDLSRNSALVIRFRREPGEAATIGIGMDNAVLDGASMLLVLADIGRRYGGDTSPLPPGPSFADHVAAHPWVTGESPTDAASRHRVEEDRKYWDQVAQRLPAAPDLVPRERLTRVDGPTFARVAADLDPSTWQQVRTVAARNGVTPAAVVLAAYAGELAAWSGQQELTVNVTRFDRDPTQPGIDRVVGDFTSLVPVGCHVRPDEELWDLAARIQTQLAEAGDHDTAGTLWVQRRVLQRTGDPVAALLPVVFTCGLGLAPEGTRLDDFGFGRLVHAASQTPQTMLDLQVSADAHGLHLTADHVTELLGSTEVQHHVSGIVTRLAASVAPVATPPSQAGATLHDQIHDIWREILDLPPGGQGLNFFTAGGDSLRATRCVRLLRERIHPGIDLRMLLVNPDLDRFVTAVSGLSPHPSTIDDSTTGIEEGTL